MPPIVKDNVVPSTTSENSAARSSTTNVRPDETANRPQPVALEVPVTVNGARTVEGSDKREPFSESTKTVLIFGNGAVIRLSSPVTAGQLLFLTNEKTKKEVVCQVVKSKNYRNVSGYVELEFTEPVVGFWGMRFPGDRLAAPSPAASAIPPAVAPRTPKVITPVVNAAPKTPDVKPAPTPLAAKPSIPAVNAIPVPSKTVPPVIPVVPATIKQDPVATSGENPTEALKLQAARLQEQLSSMLFSGGASSQPPQTPVSTTQDRLEASEAAARIFEMTKTEPAAVPSVPPARVSPPKSSLDTEEVKIPAWLEPLARNAAAPESTQELIEREKAKLAAQPVESEEQEMDPLPLTPVQETETPVQTEEPAFGSRYSHEEESIDQVGVSGGSKKGIWIGVAAAAILVVGAGGWYFARLSSPTPQTSAAVTTPAAPAAQQPQTVAQSVIPTPAAPVPSSNANVTNSARPGGNSAVSNSPAPNTIASTEKVNPKPSSNTRETTRDTTKEAVRTISAAETERVKQPVAPEPKKPVLSEVHPVTPKVNRSTAQNGVSEPSLPATDLDANGATLGSGLAITNSKQPAAPAAPLPVGGDVKPAKLASSVSPIYPSLARSQHVSGDVKVDALIDATGKVTTMKVISGPTLLHQAAMDALRQWKYQPATLDGNPVPMHLTVTLQFRLQ